MNRDADIIVVRMRASSDEEILWLIFMHQILLSPNLQIPFPKMIARTPFCSISGATVRPGLTSCN